MTPLFTIFPEGETLIGVIPDADGERVRGIRCHVLTSPVFAYYRCHGPDCFMCDFAGSNASLELRKHYAAREIYLLCAYVPDAREVRVFRFGRAVMSVLSEVDYLGRMIAAIRTTHNGFPDVRMQERQRKSLKMSAADFSLGDVAFPLVDPTESPTLVAELAEKLLTA